MPSASLEGRIADQFSYRGDRADVWRALDLLLDTDAFLNMGYSARYQPHVVGSSQRRLVDRVGDELSAHLDATAGVRLLDVGCGRGGPASHLADRYGFDVTGLDLVPYNVARATENARERGPAGGPGRSADASPSFVVGDAAQLPFAPGSFGACTAIDALVYLSDRPAVFDAVADVLEPGGTFVVSDLFVRADAAEGGRARDRVAAFADAWDMPFPGTVAAYERGLADAGLCVHATTDISSHSVRRFRTWTAPFLALADGPLGGLVDRALRRYGLDPEAVTEQVRRAHDALPALRHVLVVAQKEPRPRP